MSTIKTVVCIRIYIYCIVIIIINNFFPLSFSGRRSKQLYFTLMSFPLHQVFYIKAASLQ